MLREALEIIKQTAMTINESFKEYERLAKVISQKNHKLFEEKVYKLIKTCWFQIGY